MTKYLIKLLHRRRLSRFSQISVGCGCLRAKIRAIRKTKIFIFNVFFFFDDAHKMIETLMFGVFPPISDNYITVIKKYILIHSDVKQK
jgi:hypothetical protein